jgi:hypothetical protein
MRTEKEIREQLGRAYDELHRIEKNTKSGKGFWRMQKRYIDGLEYALGE